MKGWLLAALAVSARAAAADRDYCPERPGIDTPACIVDTGRVSVETSVADWTLDRDRGDRTDTVLVGDTLVRLGVSPTVEARFAWTPFGHQSRRGAGSADRVGDVELGLKANLLHPDGTGLSVAVLPAVSLPVGRAPIGAGDWSARLLLPVSYDLSDRLQLDATPELDAAADEDGGGRHFAYSLAGGLGWKLTDAVTLVGEGQVERDDDPAGQGTHALAALSLAVAANKDLQFDLFGARGLNRATPHWQLQAGLAARF